MSLFLQIQGLGPDNSFRPSAEAYQHRRAGWMTTDGFVTCAHGSEWRLIGSYGL